MTYRELQRLFFLTWVVFFLVLASCEEDEDSSFNLLDLEETADRVLDLAGKKWEAKEKNFRRESLFFVTPWNKDGFEFTKKFANKVDYVSPVWFDLKMTLSKSEMYLQLEGHHNVNNEYMKALKDNNPNIKIVPRIYLAADNDNMLQILSDYEKVGSLGGMIREIFRVYPSFDGILFDSPYTSYSAMIGTDIINLAEVLSKATHMLNKQFLLSLMGSQKGLKRKKEHIKKLFQISDKVLVCTYDYASESLDQPISPFDWVTENIDYYYNLDNLSPSSVSEKLMMGMPFYGFQIDRSNKGKTHILAKDYLKVLKQHKPKINFNEKTKECDIHHKESKSKTISFYYPCLKFLKSRLELFEEKEVGVFVWEAGQGLEYFYELF